MDQLSGTTARQGRAGADIGATDATLREEDVRERALCRGTFEPVRARLVGEAHWQGAEAQQGEWPGALLLHTLRPARLRFQPPCFQLCRQSWFVAACSWDTLINFPLPLLRKEYGIDGDGDGRERTGIRRCHGPIYPGTHAPLPCGCSAPRLARARVGFDVPDGTPGSASLFA